ncbi:hypothetical protein [Nocardia colli]|uniref:hypothetical protein n=1 Tax=Nocardia colli TaxID=2545717 RepID=UPI0035DFC12D
MFAAFDLATQARFDGMDLMRAIQTIPEHERQDCLRPLFANTMPSPGYMALATLALHRRVIVLNLNWDNLVSQACHRVGAGVATFDIASDPGSWVSASQSNTGVVDIHLHGLIGEDCRFGTLETLSFSPQAERFLVDNGLQQTTACLGASINGENDLPSLFRQHMIDRDPMRPTSQHWYFVRSAVSPGADDRLRQALTSASSLTYVSDVDIDFDDVATLMVDSALALISGGPPK